MVIYLQVRITPDFQYSLLHLIIAHAEVKRHMMRITRIQSCTPSRFVYTLGCVSSHAPHLVVDMPLRPKCGEEIIARAPYDFEDAPNDFGRTV